MMIELYLIPLASFCFYMALRTRRIEKEERIKKEKEAIHKASQRYIRLHPEQFEDLL